MCFTSDLKTCSRNVRRLLYNPQPLHEIEQKSEVKNMASILKREERKSAEAWQVYEESKYADTQLRNQLYRLM
jgi:hypothetical protein